MSLCLPSLFLFLYPFISTLCCSLLLPFLCSHLLLSQRLRLQLGGLKSNVHVASTPANGKTRSKPESVAMESLQQCVGQLLLPWSHQQPIWMLWYPTGITVSPAEGDTHLGAIPKDPSLPPLVFSSCLFWRAGIASSPPQSLSSGAKPQY